jgi:3-dehydroquinate synthase
METNLIINSNLYNYEVEFVNDFEMKIKDFDQNTVFVIDNNVYELYCEKISSLPKEKIFLMDAVEEKKNIETIMQLIYSWKEKGLKKNWKVVCIGGGITQDITTFASNIYLRNIDWFFFPTTLLAMCDSCIGGKCGINLDGYKNQLGVFYPPKKIFICTEFLHTLKVSDYLNGWGELLKFSLTENKNFFEKLESEESYIPCAKIDEYIYDGLLVKKNIIELDEFEGDLRRVLNYGHTFGHALEAYTNNEIPHGTAVIWGIDVVNYIAMKENVFSSEEYFRVKKLIYKSFLQKEIVVERPKDIFNILSTDKKVRDNVIYLAVPDHIGSLVIYPMTLDEKLESYFEMYLEETHEYYCNRLWC